MRCPPDQPTCIIPPTITSKTSHHQLVVEPQDLDTFVGAQQLERLDVLRIELRERPSDLGLCCGFDQGTLRSRQSIPQRLVNTERCVETGLVEARVIIIISHLIEPEPDIRPGSVKLGRIDRAGFERTCNLTGWG
jgi:hypothetical protein